jgi:hypothetical protein
MEGDIRTATTRLSQHDYVDAGLARYDPYPFASGPIAPRGQVVAALPALFAGRPMAHGYSETTYARDRIPEPGTLG